MEEQDCNADMGGMASGKDLFMLQSKIKRFPLSLSFLLKSTDLKESDMYNVSATNQLSVASLQTQTGPCM